MTGKVANTVVALAAFGMLMLVPHAGFTQSTDYEPEQLKDVGVDEQRGALVPLDLNFVDENGKAVTLADYFNGNKPVILTLNYYKCPQLCTLQLNGLVDAMQRLDWVPGKEFELVTVSFNPLEGPTLAKQKKQGYIKLYNQPEAAGGWHFLTGKQPEITKLAETVGFKYKYVEEDQQFVHVAALIILTPEGRVSRYIYGVQMEPRDVKLTLLEAADGNIGDAGDQILLFCYQYDPNSGTYVMGAITFMRIGGILTLVFFGGLVGFHWLRERQRAGMALTLDQDEDSKPKEAI